MTIHFHKYQGTGNDFVLIDDRTNTFPVSQSLVSWLCHRRFGIGADGLILLQNHPSYNFRMVYFNADGKEGSLCGNGGRCAVQFAHDLGIVPERATFEAADGSHEAYVHHKLIHLKMADVNQVAQHPDYFFLHTGSPHYVTFVEDAQAIDVVSRGKSIRYGEPFGSTGGTNVNFVQVTAPDTLFVRTYERGVEDETFSCGTGVTACAIAASFRHLESPVYIQTPGGKLQVSFTRQPDGSFTDVWLIGPAEKVFAGEVDPPSVQ